MFVWLLAMSLSAAGPQMDVATICRPARTAALPEDKASSYDNCVREESEARRQIQQSWSQYSAGVRSDCTFPSGVSESYVELLTCLELESGKGFGTPANSPGAPLLHSAAAGRTR